MDLNPIRALQKYAEKDPDILALIVFGSYNRGEPYQDIDICLILFPDSNIDPFDKRLSYVSNSSEKLDIQIFQSLPIYIKSRIMKEGTILFNKDYDALFDLYIDTIKEYGLFQPHLDLYLEV